MEGLLIHAKRGGQVMLKRHWEDADFKVVKTTPGFAADGKGNRYGYCAKCFGDMQQFGGKHILHYNSHKMAKSLGLWGKQ